MAYQQTHFHIIYWFMTHLLFLDREGFIQSSYSFVKLSKDKNVYAVSHKHTSRKRHTS